MKCREFLRRLGGALALARVVALALGLFVTPLVSGAIDTIAEAVTSRVPIRLGHLAFVSPAQSQPAAPTTSQSDVLAAYNNAVSGFKAVLSQRRAQINASQPLPNVPGQALYLARNNMISTYKDLTEAFPA